MCCVIIYVYSGEKREFNTGQFFADLFTVGLEAVAFGGAAKGLRNAETASWCFVAGTLVATEDGQKPIEEIQAGDKVLSENPETGEVAYKTVEETYENETTELVHVFVNGEEIITTPSHPFYVPKLGWTLAIKLRAGDILVLSNGEYVVVEAIQHELLEAPIKVYNFEVEDFHTYFVGESGVLVHNECTAKYDEQTNIVEIEVSKVEYGAAASHIEEYINNPRNNNLFTINRGENGANIKLNRKESLAGYPTKSGYDRDEFPMAMFAEGGNGASVKYIDPHSNRSLGSTIGRLLRDYADGTHVKFKIVD